MLEPSQAQGSRNLGGGSSPGQNPSSRLPWIQPPMNLGVSAWGHPSPVLLCPLLGKVTAPPEEGALELLGAHAVTHSVLVPVAGMSNSGSRAGDSTLLLLLLQDEGPRPRGPGSQSQGRWTVVWASAG